MPKTGSILRKLLIIVPVVLALVLISLFLPARQVTIKGIGNLSLSVGQEAAFASPGGMQQVIVGGYNDALSNTAAEDNCIASGCLWVATSPITKRQVVSTAGTLKNLFVELSAAPGNGTSYTFTVMKNDAATSLAVTISGTATTGSDTSNTVSVVAGDRIQLRSTYSGTPATPWARWSVMFEGSNAKESLILGMGATSTTQTRYAPIVHAANWSTATENQNYQIIPTSGTIKNLYVALSADPGTSPDAYRFTLRRNGASTALTVTITADNTTGNDTTNQVTVAAGDYVNLMIEPLNTPSAAPAAWWGMTFVADTDGESLILGQSSDRPATGATEYNHLTTTIDNTAWAATESNFYQGGQWAVTLKKLYVRLEAAPGAGRSYTIKPRVNGADSGISVTISNSNTTGNDTVNTKILSDFDDLNMACTPSGTPAAAMVYWGLVCYIAPNITNAPSSFDFQTVQAGVNEDTGNAYFTITNNSTMTIDIHIKCNGWSPVSGTGTWSYGSPIGADRGFLKASSANGGAGGSGGQGLYDIEILNGTDSLLCDDVGTGTNPTWELQLNTPSSFTHGDEQQTTVTLTATAS